MKQVFCVSCPYCKSRCVARLDMVKTWESVITLCDTEAQGCGQRFVVEVELRPFLRVYKLSPAPAVIPIDEAPPTPIPPTAKKGVDHGD